MLRAPQKTKTLKSKPIDVLASFAYTVNMATLGGHIRTVRLESGRSLRGLAAGVGISPAHQSDIEHGRRMPSDEVLKAIADALDIPLADLKELDPRLDPSTYEWIQETPEVVQVLRAVRERFDDPAEKLRDIHAELLRTGKRDKGAR
jgi:transcriptional regulator with XRE-family HTH domain